MFFVKIGLYGDANKKLAEKSLVKAVGGKIYADQTGSNYAIFDDGANVPMSSSAKKYSLVAIPKDWKEDK